jgi:predicted ATPase
MRLRSFHARFYRSLRSIRMELGEVSVFVGENGTGKSNLYQALRLLRACATNTLSANIVAEGGMGSVLWSGTRKKGEDLRVVIEAVLSDEQRAIDYSYRVEVGLPPPVSASFPFEAHVKEEELSVTAGQRPAVVLSRDHNLIRIRDESGRLVVFAGEVLPSETALGVTADEGRSPELGHFRRAVSQWRFFHGFRTDAGSPLRQPCPAVLSPLLTEDGGNLAAVFATVAHVAEDMTDIDHAVSTALQGMRLVVPQPVHEARIELQVPDFPERRFTPRELSDGQLRFLALCGALQSYRRPTLIGLNEPEASLHPSMLAPLAEMIGKAAQKSQIWVVTHSEQLADEIGRRTGTRSHQVLKKEGETSIAGVRFDGSWSDE